MEHPPNSKTNKLMEAVAAMIITLMDTLPHQHLHLPRIITVIITREMLAIQQNLEQVWVSKKYTDRQAIMHFLLHNS